MLLTWSTLYPDIYPNCGCNLQRESPKFAINKGILAIFTLFCNYFTEPGVYIFYDIHVIKSPGFCSI